MGGALAELNKLGRHRGQFAATLAMEGLLKKRQWAAEHAAGQVGRAIPTSGPGRRRAKAIRNRDAITAMRTDWRDITPGVFEISAWTRGKHYETDYVERDVTPDLLAQVLAWCSTYPTGEPLPESGALTFYRDEDGTVSIRDEAPDVLAFSAELLTVASPQYLSFADGVLTMNVQPEPLHYRPLGPDPRSFMVVFERVRDVA